MYYYYVGFIAKYCANNIVVKSIAKGIEYTKQSMFNGISFQYRYICGVRARVTENCFPGVERHPAVRHRRTVHADTSKIKSYYILFIDSIITTPAG